MTWNPFKLFRRRPKPVPPPAAAPLPEVRRFSEEKAPVRKRLYVWAESPEQRRRIESSLSQDQWLTLPTAQTGQPLVNLVRAGKTKGIIFQYREETPAVMESLRLLEAECPDCPRLVLCADEAKDVFRTWQGVPPTVLRESSPPAENEERVARAVTLNQWLTQPAIRPVLPRLRSIPTLPAAHQRVVEALRNPHFSSEEVARLLANDPALTTNLFKTVNSAAFGLGRPVEVISDAITMLGVERLQALVMSAWAFHFIDDRTCAGFSPQAEWEHAMAVAAGAQKLGRKLGLPSAVVEAGFTAGMLHDVGKLLLAGNIPKAYSLTLADAKESGRELWQAEREDMGFSHAEIGACMLGIWGTALPIVEAVAWHHQPSAGPQPQLSPLTLVHLANCEVRGLTPDPAQVKLAGAAWCGTVG